MPPPAGILFIITAPSGAGKTSLVRALISRDPSLTLSVSHTTRPPRPGEIDGEHYHFVTPERFTAMVQADAFLEWAEVHGNCYGTARANVESTLASGRDLLLEIDWQGAQQVRAKHPAVGIFILPPSFSELEARLRRRATETPETIQRRLFNARRELEHVDEFEYAIINDSFDRALSELHAIVQAERCRTVRQRQRHPLAFQTP
ncbi:MAG: guanylate kinase [Hydrogenophilus sp.]|nr:guanylate kinase [Hydrogenophilus sp.]